MSMPEAAEIRGILTFGVSKTMTMKKTNNIAERKEKIIRIWSVAMEAPLAQMKSVRSL